MQSTSIKDQIKKFVELQKIDTEVYKIKKNLNVIPGKLAEIEAQFEEKRAHLKSLEDQLKKLQTERKELDLELKEMEEAIAKGNAQLMQLKTNKEYSAKITEIEGVKADKSVQEDKILEMMDGVEKIQQQINEEKQRLTADEQQYQSEKSAIDAEAATIRAQVEELSKGRVSLVAEAEPNALSRYEKILEKKQGLAIVPVLKGNKCGGCFMNLTQQKINEIRAYKELIHCENCVRIIYLEEELDLPNG